MDVRSDRWMRRPRHRRGFVLLLLLALALIGGASGYPPVALAAGGCIVTIPDDSGVGSLRACLADTNVGAITFQNGLAGPITLASALPTIGRDLTITGPTQLQLKISGNDAVRIFEVTNGTVAISDLTLTHGRSANDYGGGISQSGGKLTVTNVIFDTNSAPSGGGGIALTAGELTVTGSTLNKNSASYGGGIVQLGGTLVVNNTLFTSNTAQSSGGGIAQQDGTLTVDQGVFSRNTADFMGGGISKANGALTVTASTFTGNDTLGGFGGGIGHITGGGAITLANSTISGNHAGTAGGVYAGTTLTITGSTISGNTAFTGAGITGGGPLNMTNSTVSGNSAQLSGGGIVSAGPTTLSFVTVTGNIGDLRSTGASPGGGLLAAGPTTIVASILVGNTLVTSGGSGDDCAISGGTITSGGGNVVGSGTGCPTAGGDDSIAGSVGGVLNATLADNGGATKSHALVPGSPAIDRVTLSACQTLLAAPRTDQRGQSRPQGGACDSGAYEAQQRMLTTSVNGPGTINPAGGFFLDGGVANLSAVPNAGGVFSGWTVDGSPAGTTNPLAVTMRADHAVVATFGAQLSLTTSGEGQVVVSPPGGAVTGTTQQYAAGSVVTLTPQPARGQTFIGWLVDGQAAGWAVPLTITMNAGHSVQATFVSTPGFGDIPGGAAYATAIAQLAARGVIKGCDQAASPPLFCPNDPTLRAQMAALIVRALPGWSAESWPNTFTDPIPDAELWGRVATLQHYQVAQGYAAETCLAQGKSSPCFGPLDPVTYGQVLLFISRAMVNHGYWTLQPDNPTLFPELNGTGDPADRATQDHRMLVTYLHYVGVVPDVEVTPGVAFRVATPGQPVAGWGDPAPRAWFARAFWPVLDGYFSADQPGFGGNVP